MCYMLMSTLMSAIFPIRLSEIEIQYALLLRDESDHRQLSDYS